MGLGESGTYTEDNWRTGNKEIWGRGMWLGLSEWAKYVKKFVFYMNAHQRVTSAEAGINNQVDRMTHSVNISQPLLSNLCHLSMC